MVEVNTDIIVAKPHPSEVENPVRNTTQQYFKFINTEVFRPAARHFLKYGVYTFAPPDTIEYNSFWDKEEERCINGMTVGGVRITGQHYAYMNYGRILMTVGEGKRQRKITSFPKFLDMDYYYFHELELAEKNGEGMIVVKARRKGFSYKNAFNLVWKYKWFPDSFCILAAFESTFWGNTFSMFKNMIHFINEHTDWARRRLITRNDNYKEGYIEQENGVDVEKGFKSEVQCLSFKDSPQKSIGKSAEYMLFEEAGDWPGLRQAYQRSYPLFRDGNIMVGCPIIYGTGGNNANGTNEDFEYMFYNPRPFGLRAYENIYDENTIGESGWFVDEMWYREPFVDKQGNALRAEASEDLEIERDLKRQASSIDFNMFVTQHPRSAKEAFLKADGAVFPQHELYIALNRLKADNRYKKLTDVGAGILYRDKQSKEVRFKPDLKKKLSPITEYPLKPHTPTDGAIVIYQHPPDNIPPGLYKIGYDPYRHDKAGSKSLGSALVYKSNNKIDFGYDEIVAEYTGRPANIEIYHSNLEKLSEYFGNAKIMHENEVTEVISYFKRRGKLHLLERQPDSVISKAVKNSKVNRIFGCHMNDKLKDAGEKYIIRWLLTERGKDSETGEQIMNLDLLPSIPLLEELLAYNRDGNFDRVMAFMQLMFIIEEKYEQSIEEPSQNKAAKFFIENIDHMFKRRA